MTKKSVMLEKQIDITLEAQGKSKADAMGKIFAMLRKKVYQYVDGIVIHMEPVDVFIEDVEIKKIKERFMFIFMPREKEEVKVKATIRINVKYVDF
ncbi:DUF4312 family protein [Haloimpatiens massiliensis]|uniref:DUF4312 family protein n=1 Tax=Haloimpatiens massiliensis TaxID=1658110 RepID=UPI000C840619|nr:DUF4312 family protein [Haloimpatiens massiliensis]